MRACFPLAAALALGLCASAFAQEIQPPTLQVGVLPDALNVDGVLDEPAWNAAPAVENFAQTDPSEGAPPTTHTTVRVLAGPRALAIGIVCDQDPEDIVSFSVRRDALLNNEDHVRVVLGPFLDGRSGYVFSVNPSGALEKALQKSGIGKYQPHIADDRLDGDAGKLFLASGKQSVEPFEIVVARDDGFRAHAVGMDR